MASYRETWDKSVSNLDATGILSRVADVYRALPAYSDTGTVVSSVASVQFETVFRRGSYLHFAYSDVLPGRPRRDMARVTWDQGRLEFWTLLNAPAPPTLRLAIAALTGISSGAAHGVPSLLLPDEVGGWIPTDLRAPELAPNEMVDGAPCLHVRGQHPRFPDRYSSLIVDPVTWLVRRRMKHDDDQVTTYVPVVRDALTGAS